MVDFALVFCDRVLVGGRYISYFMKDIDFEVLDDDDMV